MTVFLRVISALLIFFASLSLAIAGGGDIVDSDFPAVDVHIRVQADSRIDSPWAILRPVKWEEGDDDAINPRIEFVIRGDLEPSVQRELRDWALELKLELFRTKGLWIQNPDHDSRTFLFFPFGARIPGWLAKRSGPAIVIDHVKITPTGALLRGNIVAAFDNDLEIYPRTIKSEWSLMELLNQHAHEAIVTNSAGRTMVHRGSTICAGFLEQFSRSRKPH